MTQGQGMLQVTCDIGYWLATLCFCASAVDVLVLRSSREALIQSMDAGRKLSPAVRMGVN
jgi:hypothetical protein